MLKKSFINLSRALLFAFILCNCASGQTEKKTAYAILMDNTGSMRSQFEQVLMLGKGVISRVPPQAPVMLANFRTDGRFAVVAPGIDWTRDHAVLKAYIENLQTIPGHTMMFEAIEFMAQELDRKADSEKQAALEKVMILITDGDEVILRHTGMITGPTWEDDERKRIRSRLIKKLKASGIKVYAIGLTRELESSSRIRMSRRDKAENLLKKITKETGGRAVFPQAKIDIDRLLGELLTQ